MIIEEIQGNIANLSPEEKQKHIEKVYLETVSYTHLRAHET